MTMDESQGSPVPRCTFWNAVKGRRYDCSDPLCTLKEVFYVANNENVWGNIQQTRSLANTSFSLEDAASWRPLLSQKFKERSLLTFPQQFQTVQAEIDWNRSPPRTVEAQRIEQEFNSTIQSVLEHWRSEEGRAMITNEGMNRRLHEVHISDIIKVVGKHTEVLVATQMQVLEKMEAAAHYEHAYSEEVRFRPAEKREVFRCGIYA